MNDVSKLLIGVGLFFITAGLLYHLGGKYFPFGKLPGDFSYKSEHTQVYFPFASSLLLSIFVSLLGLIWNYFSKK